MAQIIINKSFAQYVENFMTGICEMCSKEKILYNYGSRKVCESCIEQNENQIGDTLYWV
jgi:hypothetical protein